MEIVFVHPALIGALIATGLFFYGLYHIVKGFSFGERLLALAKSLGLVRASDNPIIVRSGRSWEAHGVMNPAAVRAVDRVHIFYRAVGSDGVSRIGYASSIDGVKVDERLPYPVFALSTPTDEYSKAFAHHMGLNKSGGSFAGVEDPRATVIDDRMYLSFNAFSGWNSLRVGVSSIQLDDLLKQKWNWTPPTFISPPRQVHKSWVLFPEKIDGKYAVLHSLHSGSRDSVLVDYLDTLHEEPKTPIISPYNPKTASSVWDSTLRGPGAPPIKTDKGWLLLYHANDARESHKYKLGALLLDLLNPSKVLARAPLPVLTPDAPYENDGKPGIVYACGAVADDDTLRVYYGGGDSVVCTAHTSLSKLLNTLSHPFDTLPAPALRLSTI